MLKKYFTFEIKILILTIILGAVLRLFYIFNSGFWFDEAITWHFAKLPINQLIPAVASDSNPPLYYLLIHFLLKISSNEIFLKSFSMLINLLCIPLLYLLGKKLFNKSVSLMAVIFFSVSALNIYIGSETRLHSLGELFILLSIYLFYVCLNKPSILSVFGLTFSLILAVNTQYYAWLLFPALIYIVYTTKNRLGIKKLIISLIFVTTVGLLWIITALYSNHNQCSCPSPLLAIPSIFVSPLLNGVGEVTLRSFLLLQSPIIFLFSLSGIIVIFFFIKGVRKNKLLPIFGIPLIIVSIAGIFYPVFSPKAFTVFSPFFFLILAYGITKFKHAGIIFLTVSSLFLFTSLYQITNSFFFGVNFKTTISYVKQTDFIPIYHTSITTYYPFVYYLPDQKVNKLLTANSLTADTVKYIGGQQNNLNYQLLKMWLVIDTRYKLDLETTNKIKSIEKTYIVEKNYYFKNITLKLLKHK